MAATIWNNTDFTVEQINQMQWIGETINNWRQRRIELRQHPTKHDHVISIGHSFDGKQMVIAEEPKSSWTTQLMYASQGRVYVSM